MRQYALSRNCRVLVFLLLFVALGITPARCAASFFPLQTGNYWVYRGLTKWTTGSGQTMRIHRQVLTWKMAVTRTYNLSGTHIALITGFPADLSWYDPGVKPGSYALVVTTEQRVYLLQADTRQQLVARLRRPGTNIDDFLYVENEIIELPLTTGRRFGDPEMLKRPDGFYCWNITRQWSAALNVPGIPAGQYTQYELAYRTLPDTTIFEFAPGIGITSFSYVHHGTVAETYLKLIEYHQG